MENYNENTENTEQTERTEQTAQTRQERIEELKNKIFGSEKPRRRIIASPIADIVHTSDSGETTTSTSYRAIYVLLDAINALPDEGKYEIFVKEDEEKSEPPAEGEERYRRSMTGAAMEKAELMKWLANNYLDPRQCVLEFQKMCAAMAVHSQLKNVMITMTFDGARPSGFTFFTDCAQQTSADIEALGNASLRMANGYIQDMKKQHPGELSFENDGDIVLPNSVDAAKLMKSAANAQKMMRGSK